MIGRCLNRRNGGSQAGRRRGLLAERGGSAAVELALVLPALLSVMLGIMEFGRLMWTANALHYSVEQAARCAAIDATTCGTAAQVQTFAAGLAGSGFATTNFTVTTPACGVLVVGNYTYTVAVPLFTQAVALTAQSCYP